VARGVKEDLFLRYFGLKAVEAILKVKTTTEFNEETGEQIVTPILIKGFILDADDDIIYLGETEEDVTQCIQRKDILCVNLIKESSEEDDLLNDLMEEGSKGRYN